MIRITLFSLLMVWCANGSAQSPDEVDQDVRAVLESGLSFLKERQSEDGGWHSQDYGSLKQGAALTTLVLYSLSHLSVETRDPYQDSIEAGFQFLKTGLEQSNYVTNPEGSEDYPVYCTAMLLVASERMNLAIGEEMKRSMVSYLIKSQVAESRGFDENDVEFGGWDVLGPNTQSGKTSGTNVSVTCYVIEALSFFENETKVQVALKNTQLWMERMVSRSSDGGFFFTPKLDSPNNKAGWSDPENRQPRSYGSATCDGLRILHSLGLTSEDQPVSEALEWLIQADSFDRVPGFQNDMGWAASLKFYYFASLAKSFSLLPENIVRAAKEVLAEELRQLQGEDGQWRNETALMREDDPIIATSFSIIALGLIQGDEKP